MAYQKKILYLDYYENGERLSGGGFVKLEVRQEKLRLDVTVRGLRLTDSFVRDVLLQSGEKQVKLGQLDIREGCGRFSYEERPEGERGEMSFSCLELGELKIPIGGAREIRCKLTGSGPRAAAPSERCGASSERIGASSESLAALSEKPAATFERPAAEEKDLAGGPRRQQLTAAETAVVFGKAQASPERGTGQPKESPAEEEQTARSVRRQPAEKNKRPVRLREDKWQQLSAIYPHIHPFQDEREYLSIRPADFVLFPAKYYQAVNNSFLLHGYYNYEHLILARLEQRGETQYYLGVPGSYYEREKQVALMFGFESFESASEPAKTGDFGYYMMRTQL